VNVRIIAATNKNLEELVAQNLFREDLYYRLNVIPIYLPPLRERKSDIPLLVYHFIERFNAEKKRDIQGVSPEAMEMFKWYSWPGNVRELENMIERITILKGSGMITPSDLSPKIAASSPSPLLPHIDIPEEGLDFGATIQAFEKELLQQALEKARGVRSQAAKLLHMNRTTLVEKLKKLQLDR
jgi:DNA-binding NtrC family response regulator